MAMSRSLGWTLLTTRSPIEIVPEVMFSSPASIRSKVDLPQPEGPTRTTKAPSSIGIETPCRTSKPPNDFRTSRICTDDIFGSSRYGWNGERRSRPFVNRKSYQTFSTMSSDQVVLNYPCPATLRSGREHANIRRRCEHCARKQGVCVAGEIMNKPLTGITRRKL